MPATHIESFSPPIAKSAFNPLDYPLILIKPRLISEFSAWLQHIPFAFALVSMLRPRTIVELGTFQGASYCAFCQAVEALQLDCKCTAIDTWTGDVHGGYYDGSILSDLRSHHDPLYARFSNLLQSTFDDALSKFQDGTIDLLHIDGLHTYDAVHHDFQSWLPKLSDRAVVLLHDTRERRDDFGVHQLWAEIAPHYPNFEFHHGHGLGILAIGRHISESFHSFLAAASEEPAAMRNLFASLGERIELERDLALARRPKSFLHRLRALFSRNA